MDFSKSISRPAFPPLLYVLLIVWGSCPGAPCNVKAPNPAQVGEGI